MRDAPGGDHMIDPVSGTAIAAPSSHLKLVPQGPAAIASSPTPARPPPPSPGDPGKSATGAPVAATRVYVDRSPSGVYVYQLVDAATGHILVELPRAESDSLKVLDGYEPGAATRVSV